MGKCVYCGNRYGGYCWRSPDGVCVIDDEWNDDDDNWDKDDDTPHYPLCKQCEAVKEWVNCQDCDNGWQNRVTRTVCPTCKGGTGWYQCPNGHTPEIPKYEFEVLNG